MLTLLFTKGGDGGTGLEMIVPVVIDVLKTKLVPVLGVDGASEEDG